MCKIDRHRIEDAFIPSLLEGLMLSHIEQLPERDPTVYDKAFALLRPDIAVEIGGNDKLARRLHRLEKKVRSWFVQNGWEIRKAYMIVSALADILEQTGAIELGAGTKEVVMDISEIIVEHYHEEDIKAQDESAVKQAPKLLKLLQEEGYYL